MDKVLFAGTAVNDTSSVTATASTWDSMWHLGSATLDKAVTVKLTRTLAIIPITLVLALVRTKKSGAEGKKVHFKKVFPIFILYFRVVISVSEIFLRSRYKLLCAKIFVLCPYFLSTLHTMMSSAHNPIRF